MKHSPPPQTRLTGRGHRRFGWRPLLAVLALLVGTAAGSAAQPWRSAPDQLEPGVLAPQDEPEYGVAPAAGQLEGGVLGPADELEDGVLGRADELESGLIGLDDPLFRRPRALRPAGTRARPRPQDPNRLEAGLVGLDDPLFR